MQHMPDNIQYMFDCWVEPDAHLFLAKSASPLAILARNCLAMLSWLGR